MTDVVIFPPKLPGVKRSSGALVTVRCVSVKTPCENGNLLGWLWCLTMETFKSSKLTVSDEDCAVSTLSVVSSDGLWTGRRRSWSVFSGKVGGA